MEQNMKNPTKRRVFVKTSLLTTSGIIFGTSAGPGENKLMQVFIKAIKTKQSADKQVKILFFDYREVETISGFTREPGRPFKHEMNPLFTADKPSENGNMQLYGV